MDIKRVDSNTVAGIFELYDTKAIVLIYKKDVFMDTLTHRVEIRYCSEKYVNGDGRPTRDLLDSVKFCPKILFTDDLPILKQFLQKHHLSGKFLITKDHIVELEKELNPKEWNAIEEARKQKEQHEEIARKELLLMKQFKEPKHIDDAIEVDDTHVINVHHFRSYDYNPASKSGESIKLILTFARVLNDEEILTSKKKPKGNNRPMTKCGAVPKMEYIYAYKKDLVAAVNDWLAVNGLSDHVDDVFAKIEEVEKTQNLKQTE